MPAAEKLTVLHYVGYDADRGGIVSVVRALAGVGRFACVLGMNRGCVQERTPPLAVLELPRIAGEKIGVVPAMRALVVARAVREWLRSGPSRIFHGHSRAGLLVALWLAFLGERRVAVTVRTFGRQQWFYRWAAGRLGQRLYWLGPAMKRHYGVGTETWSGCLPDCVPDSAVCPARVRPVRRMVTFGCAGTLVPWKKWELVLQALACVPREVPLRGRHVGSEDGSVESRAYAARLRRLGEKLGVADRWEWRGAAGDMASFYGEIDCLIVPSPLEASSVAALEAIAAGVPVLASAASGTRDLVVRCGGGWLFAANSAEALGQRMVALASGPELAAWRRDDGGVAEFTASRVAATHLAVYQALLAG